MIEILVITAMTLLIFISIICMVALKSGIHITVRHDISEQENIKPGVASYTSQDLEDLQSEVDKEYKDATNAIKDMSSVLKEFMCGPEKKEHDSNEK